MPLSTIIVVTKHSAILLSWRCFKRSEKTPPTHKPRRALTNAGFSSYCDSPALKHYLRRGDTPLVVAKRLEKQLRREKRVDAADPRVVWHLRQNADGQYVELYYKFTPSEPHRNGSSL